MKHTAVYVVAAMMLAPAAFAADAGTTFIPAQAASQYLAKDHLIGAKVTGKDGKIIGDVEDLIINDQNQVVGVVMGTGGYFGIAEKKVGLELASLKFEEKDGKLTVALPDVSPETLKTAPAFQRAKPPKSLFDRAKEKVHELKDKTSASTHEAIEDAKPMLDDAKKKAGEAYDKAKEAVSGAVDSAKHAAEDATKGTTPATPAPAPAP